MILVMALRWVRWYKNIQNGACLQAQAEFQQSIKNIEKSSKWRILAGTIDMRGAAFGRPPWYIECACWNFSVWWFFYIFNALLECCLCLQARPILYMFWKLATLTPLLVRSDPIRYLTDQISHRNFLKHVRRRFFDFSTVSAVISTFGPI